MLVMEDRWERIMEGNGGRVGTYDSEALLL